MSDTHKNLVAGRWLDGVSLTENRNPSDVSDLIGLYASGSAEDVHRAAEAAADAQRSFYAKGPQARADLLDRIAAGIEAKVEPLAHMLAREEGKILSEARAETIRASQIFRFFAGEALRLSGESVASVRAGVDVDIRREPLGVVGLITPWNFPIAIPAWKIAPALAYGNAVILKPADLTPGTAHLLAEIIVEAGCPAGLFNLVMGPGSRIGPAMLSNPLVQAVSFTGSVPTGRGIARSAAESLKKVQLEMGGKNPMVVMDDADIDLAVAACLNGAFFSTGQRCTASSRLIVQERIHDRFVEALSKAALGLKVGPALAADSQMGPVASASQLDHNLAYVALAREEGCEVLGGERIDELPQGHFQKPAIFVGATNDMRVSREEIFGPCASVIKVGDFEEAVAVANDTEFGLSSGICTGSLKYAREFQRRSTAGMVMVNLPTAGVDYHVPFGGRKGSSHGPREQGRYAAEFYTTVKTSYVFAG
ncbi:aldehyde dehydrogenase family protein [Rhizobium wuzhouense]|uniref:Aldehyde dehydrogenase family protein n=1 Tax=Rhizobium wuzhouense TaxID=1986026 RepID=A0ABX5NUJ0_9HYPH|nr:aldehyde dehydrogenase family protein [Rhizobium wuzhouense]PYB72374.1 aldehyde dehydrogenase family protein [Rhizobium wuzhouense]